MKKKEILIASLLLILIVFFAGLMTFNTLSNQDLKVVIKDKLFDQAVLTPAIVQPEQLRCSHQEPLQIDSQRDPNLTALSDYQDVCGSLATNKMMFFISFPFDARSANEDAAFIVAKLRHFQHNKIAPIVIVEPYVGGKPMSYKDFLDGKFDNALDAYFQKIKKEGITDDMMGTWVPFPESNTPSWNNDNTEPKDFALCVNKYLGMMKKYFPSAKGSILLNATTYEPADTEWNNGDYLNLVPYLQDIDRSLVSSFGIQGFPWVSKATAKKRAIFKASEFLQPDLAIAAAQELRTKDIWINTGTFAAKYTGDIEQKVDITFTERRAILSDILGEAKKISSYQADGYRVSINLFSEDKGETAEGTDWSYFQDDDMETIMKEFFWNAESGDISVSLYDAAHRAI